MNIKTTFGGGRPPVYKTADGKRCPSVTTVIGRFKASEGLVNWAWKVGLEGGDIHEERESAAGAGKIAHAWIDDEVHGRPLTPYPDIDPEMCSRATTALDAFRVWRTSVNLEIIDTERPYISEELRVGGTYDALARAGNRELVLVDWKTSNKIYSEYVVQLSAYAGLVRECTGEAVNGAHLLRVGKEFADFHHSFYPSAVLSHGWEAFKLMRRLYELDAVLKKVA